MHLPWARPIVAGCLLFALAPCARRASAALNGPGCISDLECEDNNPCTADVCFESACLNVPVDNGIPCPDGVFCNGEETCQIGDCTSGQPACDDPDLCDEESETCHECNDGSDCDDANPCTQDICGRGECFFLARVNGTPCPDSNFCNGPESCFAGECVAGEEPCEDLSHCDAAGQACLVDLNLVWRPAVHFVGIEQSFQTGLYAVPSDLATDAPISAVQANLEWNRDLIEGVVFTLENEELWLFSGMPGGSQACGANDTFSDGDAYYRSLASFVTIPVAPPEGLLLATFDFRARVETLAAEINIVESSDPLCETTIVSGAVPGLAILRTVGPIRIRATDPPILPGDGNGDALVDLDDYALFLECVTGPGGDLLPGCEPFDFDIDLDVDSLDFAGFQRHRHIP